MTHFAMVFPGQGSQAVGMLSELAEHYPQVQTQFAQASQILGYDLWRMVQQGPLETLNQTAHTQPALLAASVAIYTIWLKQGGAVPKILAGHSLGEYSALVCAQSLAFSHAIKLVETRGRLMQQAVPQGVGAMAAIIGLTDEQVQTLCQQVAGSDCLAPANYNAHGQVVIAGHDSAVERAISEAKQQGAKIAKKLAVSVPSHCALMKPAAEELASLLENTPFEKPKIAVINNVDVEVQQHPDDIREALLRQLYHPVRWVETVERMRQEGIEQTFECGPGKVLAGLIKRIDRSLSCAALDSSTAMQTALQEGVKP